MRDTKAPALVIGSWCSIVSSDVIDLEGGEPRKMSFTNNPFAIPKIAEGYSAGGFLETKCLNEDLDFGLDYLDFGLDEVTAQAHQLTYEELIPLSETGVNNGMVSGRNCLGGYLSNKATPPTNGGFSPASHALYPVSHGVTNQTNCSKKKSTKPNYGGFSKWLLVEVAPMSVKPAKAKWVNKA